MSHPGVEAITPYLAELSLFGGTILEQRTALDQMSSGSGPPEGVTVEPVSLGERGGEWLSPTGGASDAAVLYLHGGGYCIGSLDTHRQLAGRVAVATGCGVAALDYRLAPEHPFPAAVDDATAAYRDLLSSGLLPERIAIAGDSAGGGLTMSVLLALRAAGTPLPAAAACLSPWTDLTQSSAAYSRLADRDPMVSKSGLDLMARSYLGFADPRSELVSPLYAADFGGLPPVRIEVGECEVLIDDATRLVERLEGAGTSVSLIVWPQMFHVFQAFPASVIPESDRSISGIGSFLAEHLGLARATVDPQEAG